MDPACDGFFKREACVTTGGVEPLADNICFNGWARVPRGESGTYLRVIWRPKVSPSDPTKTEGAFVRLSGAHLGSPGPSLEIILGSSGASRGELGRYLTVIWRPKTCPMTVRKERALSYDCFGLILEPQGCLWRPSWVHLGTFGDQLGHPATVTGDVRTAPVTNVSAQPLKQIM